MRHSCAIPPLTVFRLRVCTYATLLCQQSELVTGMLSGSWQGSWFPSQPSSCQCPLLFPLQARGRIARHEVSRDTKAIQKRVDDTICTCNCALIPAISPQEGSKTSGRQAPHADALMLDHLCESCSLRTAGARHVTGKRRFHKISCATCSLATMCSLSCMLRIPAHGAPLHLSLCTCLVTADR